MTADRDRFVDRGRDTDRVVEFQRSVDGARVVCEVRTSRRRLAVVHSRFRFLDARWQLAAEDSSGFAQHGVGFGSLFAYRGNT